MSVLGNRVLRTEDPRMLTEGARYVADLRFDGLARVCFVRSTVACGRLVGVDAVQARTQPGVLGVFTAADLDLPDLAPIGVVHQQMPTPLNPLGAKGIGESGTVGAGPAVLNAIHDAAAHLGATHIDMPATPQRIWRALQDRGNGQFGQTRRGKSCR